MALSGSAVLTGGNAGSSSVFLTARDLEWTVTANNSFLHVTPGSGSGAGSAPIAFTVDAFTGTGVRTGTLTIAGLTFTVTQVGADYVAASQLNTVVSGGLGGPTAVAADGFGNLYIVDLTNKPDQEVVCGNAAADDCDSKRNHRPSRDRRGWFR